MISSSRLTALVLFCACAANIQAAGIQLQYASTVGDKARYKLTMDGGITEYAGPTNTSAQLHSEMIVTQEVIAAAAGLATLKTHVDAATGRADGHAIPIAAAGTEVVTQIRPNGDVVANPQYEGMDMKNMQVVFPQRELAVNDTWTVTLPPANGIPIPLTVTYKVVGLKRLLNEDCMQISTHVQSDRQKVVDGLVMDIKSDGEMYFGYRSGHMIKNEMRSRSNLIRTTSLGSDNKRLITRVSNHLCMEYIAQ